MSREEEIKKELEQIELNKKQAVIDKQLASMTMVGKCFASHHLNRYMTNKNSYTFEVVHITGKKYDKNRERYMPYGYTGESINVYKNGSEIHINKGNFYNDNISLYKYEITLEQFNQVANGFIPSIEVKLNELRNAFAAQDWVSQGDYGDERSAHGHLDALGIEYIDLSTKDKFYGSNITVFEVLRWQHHPYLYNSRLYKLDNWMAIVQSIRNEMYKEAMLWGSSIYQRDMSRIKMLDDFILKYGKVCKNN